MKPNPTTDKPMGVGKKAPWRGLFYLERVKGIEPSLFAWEAKVLPLNDTRIQLILNAEHPPPTRLQGF